MPAELIVVVVVLTVISAVMISYKALTQTRLAERYRDNRAVQRYIKILTWASRVLPPLLLLSLFFMPFDVMTAMVWFIGGVAALYGIAGVAKKQARVNKIRPALTLVIFSTALVYMLNHTSRIREQIDSMVRQSAREVLAICNKDGSCPDMPPGWLDFCQSIETMRACYRLAANDRQFSISIRYHIDSFRVIEGGVETPLKEEVIYE